MNIKLGLGKGLGALLPPDATNPNPQKYFLCPIEAIDPNPLQPRHSIKSLDLGELAASIKEKGVIQPLIVRPAGTRFELIAGERRWRASQLAGLQEVPVVVTEVSSTESLELALIENIQRQDLNALEEAMAYERLLREFDLTQEEVARKVGKERSTVANYVRLLSLPDYAKQDLINGALSMGHARVLLSLDDPETQRALRDQIIAADLSVRQSETLARKLKNQQGETTRKAEVENHIPDAYCQTLRNELMRYLGTKVIIHQKGKRGKLEIEYYSGEDLERLLGLIVAQEEGKKN